MYLCGRRHLHVPFLHQMSDVEDTEEDTSLPYGAHPVTLSRKTQERLEVLFFLLQYHLY